MFKLTKAQNQLVKQIIIIVIIVAGLSVSAALVFTNSSYITGTGHFVEQPIAFSHETHVNEVGLKCEFCHTGVAHNSSAEMPSMETCYGCHREVLANSSYLEGVRRSYETKKSIGWQRVNKLADHVHFQHSGHIQAGVQCVTCHGSVEHMPLMAPKQKFSMQYCLDCHKQQKEAPRLQDCYTCHR